MNYERRPPQEDVDAAASYGLDFIDFTNPFGLFHHDYMEAGPQAAERKESADVSKRSAD